MIEIRIHGRGGQGAVTTSQLLAIAGFIDGKYTQAFPNFGVERAGAPVQAFTRISKKYINLRQQVYFPDILIVLDASLFNNINVTAGLKKGGIVIVNSNKSPKDLGIGKKCHAFCIDATSIASNETGRAIVNTPILGAFSRITELISINSLLKAIEQRFSDPVIQKINKKAILGVYNSTKISRICVPGIK